MSRILVRVSGEEDVYVFKSEIICFRFALNFGKGTC